MCISSGTVCLKLIYINANIFRLFPVLCFKASFLISVDYLPEKKDVNVETTQYSFPQTRCIPKILLLHALVMRSAKYTAGCRNCAIQQVQSTVVTGTCLLVVLLYFLLHLWIYYPNLRMKGLEEVEVKWEGGAIQRYYLEISKYPTLKVATVTTDGFVQLCKGTSSVSLNVGHFYPMSLQSRCPSELRCFTTQYVQCPSVCVCMCMCGTYVWISVHVYFCIYIYVYVLVYVYLGLCMVTYICISMYICMQTQVFYVCVYGCNS